MTTFDRIISATVRHNGEVIEYVVRTPAELTDAYQEVESYIEAYRQLKSGLMNTSMEMLKQQDNKEK